MASLLRRPGNLARYSRITTECAARIRPSPAALSHSRLPCLTTSHHPRTYATGPLGNPKSPRGKKTPKNGGSNGENGGENANNSEQQRDPNNVLTEKQNRDVDFLIKTAYDYAPKGTAREIEVFLNYCKQKGLPPQIEEMIDLLREPNMNLKTLKKGFDIFRTFDREQFLRTFADVDRAEFKRQVEILKAKQEGKFEANAGKPNDGQQESPLDKQRHGEEQGKGQAEDQKSQKTAKEMEEEKEQNGQKDPEKEIRDKLLEEQKKWRQEREEKNQREQKDKKGRSQDDFDFKVFNIKLDANTMIVSTIVSYMLYRSVFPGETSKDITWQEFRNTFFDKGLVEKLTVVNKDHVRVELHRDAVANVYPESPASRPGFYYYFTIGSIEAFERRLDEAHNELGIPPSERIPVSYVDKVSWIGTILATFGPTALFIGALALMSRRAGGGAGQSGIFGIGKSRAKRFNHESGVQTKFADVAGMDEAKVEIMEFVSFLKKPEQFRRLGAKIPRGAILSGPPGTGKTLLAKATAGESGVPFFSVSGSEFVEMFVGVGPSRVRDLFANARKNAPCIIFIDEIDAIGKSRAKSNFGGGNDERESTLNQILTEMDGFNTSEQVVVLAGTNRPDVLDKALMRPGRFDRHISIDRPTMDGRKQIFAVHLKKIVTNEDMEYLKGRLAALTPGFSGADIANCVNEAALVAARGVADSVTMKHFEQAIERVIGGLEKKSLVLSPEEKRTVAYHEAGHAICGWFFKHADPLLKVSIIPRGQGALGYAQYLPARGDTYLMDVHQLMDRMAMALGGRVSEELHFDTVTSGASDDFNKVTRMATAMVTKFGMSQKIGYIYFEEDQQQFHKPFSEETAKNIDMEVRRLVEEAYNKCRNLLIEKKKEVGIVAEELLSKEVLSRDDLIRLLGKRPFPESGEFTKYFDGAGGKGTIAPPPPVNEEGKTGPEASG